jgi:hypothetical protein
MIVDVPMSRVKFNVNSEYAYLQNFKVLQSTCVQRRSRCETKPLPHDNSHEPPILTMSFFPCIQMSLPVTKL